MNDLLSLFTNKRAALLATFFSVITAPQSPAAECQPVLMTVAGGSGSEIVHGTCELEPPPMRLANIAARSVVGSGDDLGIGGFIVAGPASKQVLVRGIGSSLKSDDSPLPGRLMDPTIELRAASGELIAANDDWEKDPKVDAIRASGLAPKDEKESAVLATLNEGSYTVVLRGANGSEGIGVVEIYDRQVTSETELVNLAARAYVSTGDDVLIGGFFVNGAPAKRVLIRAIGPSLAGTVPDELKDPTIELINGDGVKVGENDDWRKASNASEIEITGAAPAHEKESVILLPLGAGSYTATVRGKNETKGNGVIEIYRLD